MRRPAGALFTGLLLALGGASCSSDEPAGPEVVDALIDRRWFIAGYVDGGDVFEVAPAGDDASIMFEGNGRVNGDDGCNGFSYEGYDISAEQIRFEGPRAMELQLCFDVPDLHYDHFNAAVGGTVDYELDGDRLVLIGDDGLGVVFTR